MVFPGLRYSQDHYYEILRGHIPRQCDWLDMGCGHQMFDEWMRAEQDELAARAKLMVGVDLDWEGLRKNPFLHHKIYGNLDAVPLKSGSFYEITANMVVEHLEHPAAVLLEAKRLLRPNGTFVFHTPNSKCMMMRVGGLLPQSVKNLLIVILESRAQEDVFPTHYRMNTHADIRRLAGEAGFSVERIQVVSTTAITAALGPLAAVELLYLRWIEGPGYDHWRSNLQVILRRPQEPG